MTKVTVVGNDFTPTWRYKWIMLRRMWRNRHNPLRVQVLEDGKWKYLADTSSGLEKINE